MSANELDNVKSVFTHWAPRYDPTHALLPFRSAACRALGLQRGERVLDIACGTGLNLARLRRAVGEDGEVIGVDLTPAMLDVAHGRVRKQKWTNVHVVEGDAAHLAFPDSEFDKVLVAFGLYIIPDYEAAIREAHRVLRPGGRFVDLEITLPERGPWRAYNARHPGLAHICCVDYSHDIPHALRTTFLRVDLHRRMSGWFFIAICER